MLFELRLLIVGHVRDGLLIPEVVNVSEYEFFLVLHDC